LRELKKKSVHFKFIWERTWGEKKEPGNDPITLKSSFFRSG